ncbi:UNVERIFIED_CONTAM: hypothetical protein GTU68_039015, partial [Idotea baltica]|nr:hypothetical protein [Idotea baltica]
QENCGSCYAFSATGSLEGQHFRKTGKLLSLSAQQIVDCSGSFGNLGCSGGNVEPVFNYIKSVGGIESEKSYPYADEEDKCEFHKSYVVATCSGYVQIPSGNEMALQEAVATIGPVSVAIDAHFSSFKFYKHGVYNEPNCFTNAQNLDHAVLVVGYGVENGLDYWLVKNSWGTKHWGADGYIKMSRNKNNQCGIATDAVYPIV